MGSHQRGWIWGRHAVLEALRNDRWAPAELHLSDELNAELRCEAESGAARLGVPVSVEPSKRLVELCKQADHQGLIARMPPFPYLDESALIAALREDALLLVLDSIHDAFNFGAAIRSAEGLGADGIVVGSAGQCEVTSQVVRSSAGAIHHVNLYRCSDLTEILGHLKSRGVRIVGASEKTDKTLSDVDLRRGVAVVVGNEGRGIARERLELCDETVAIPLAGEVESLNAAVAVGIVLYEAIRQRAVSG